MLVPPWAFSGLRFFNVRQISSPLDLQTTTAHSFYIAMVEVHLSFAFFLNLKIILPSTFSGSILGILLLFNNVFRIDQYPFGIVEGSS